MGLFDLLRGVVPVAAQQRARYPWNASRNPAPSWLFDPASYDWSDVVGPTPLPDRLGAPEPPEPMPLPDRPDPSFDDIHAQLVAGAASRIGPEHFALNPDNWTPPRANPVAPWPFSAAPQQATLVSPPPVPVGLDRSGDSLAGTGWPRVSSDLQPNSIIQLASDEGGKKDEEDPSYKIKRELQRETPQEDIEHGRGVPILPAPLPLAPPWAGKIGIGPYAPSSGGVPLSRPLDRPTTQEREQVNQMGRENGCHTCGTKDFGTKSGDPHVDHQPPRALNPNGDPAEGFPHCTV